jgi:hypothetical protein
MRILLSCLQSQTVHALPAYAFWRRYFVQGLREVGHEVLEVPGIDWAEGLTRPRRTELEAWRARTWQAVLDFAVRELRNRPIHLFLGYLYPKQVETSAISQLQRMGIACVNFFCDNVREFRAVPPEYRPFALHWVPEFEALPMYRVAGLPHVHLPMPCWVPVALREDLPTETEPPTFVGSADILRRDLFGRALQAGGDFVIRGRGWIDDPADSRALRKVHSASETVFNQVATVRNCGIRALVTKVRDRLHPLNSPPIPMSSIREPPTTADEYFRVMREAIVAVGVNRVPTQRAVNWRPLAYSRLRDIEAPMLGACYLTEWTEGLSRLYQLGTEVETYRTADEFSAKLRELAADPSRRRSMRRAAQRRALAEHSLARTVSKIQEIVP